MSKDNTTTGNNNNQANESLSQNTKKMPKYHPGEKGFSVFLFFFGLFFTYQSALMYMKKPGASSYAAVPLFVSVLIMVFATLIFISDFKCNSVNDGFSIGIKIKNTLAYMFPKDILVILILILVYCIALSFGIGFYIITPFFLWAGMSYLMRKNYFKNILWTTLSLLFIYIVFSFVFNVVLP